MSQWQPIETAPKDGTSILCRSEEGVWQGSWNMDAYRRIKGEYVNGAFVPLVLNEHGCGRCGTDSPQPTYWMPLPEGPNE